MKKSLLTVLALTASAIGLRAEEPASSYSITTEFTYVSKYVFRGVEAQKDSFQPSAELAVGNFTLGLWGAYALKDADQTWANGSETDIYASYSIALPQDYSLTLGAVSYQYPKARFDLGEVDKSFEGSIGVSGPITGTPLSIAGTYYRDWDLKADTFEFGLSYEKTVADNTTLGVTATYGLVRFDGAGDYDYYGLSGTVGYQITEKIALNAGAHWADTDITGLKDNTWVSVGVSAGF